MSTAASFVLLLAVAHYASACIINPPSTGCTPKACSAAKPGAQYGTETGYSGNFNFEIFVDPITSGAKSYSQSLKGKLIKSSSAGSASSCCTACAKTDGCVFFHFYKGTPKPAPPPEWDGNLCYLLGDGPIPTTPTHTQQLKLFDSYSASVVGGKCNPISNVGNDPHFVGAHGTHFDFNGEIDKSFCLISDKGLHINALLRGYYAESNATVSSEKNLRSWIKELGFMWRAADGLHTLRLVARDGKEQERGSGFLQHIIIDGEDKAIPSVGSSVAGASGVSVEFAGLEKTGPFDMDHFIVRIEGRASMDVRLRIAHPALQTATEAYTHLNLNMRHLEYTPSIHGVMGQTYRDEKVREDRAAKFQALSHLLNRNIQADGPSGKGFLDGSEEDYVSSSVLSADCNFAAFN
eukprot:TRINITY_DN0_c0_g1_i7.p1 TRINITY_DN0_c0_g1~~TRINITY_DN0_c0_g1_i7.p1  ORF type:complete len:419 (-),score=104.69 TRINITY_DN0_c0_g1_i7:59-1279(-)